MGAVRVAVIGGDCVLMPTIDQVTACVLSRRSLPTLGGPRFWHRLRLDKGHVQEGTRGVTPEPRSVFLPAISSID